MTWRTTKAAELDLDAIATFGAKNYGIDATLQYYDGLIDVFALLAANPRMARERHAAGRSGRLHRFKGHNILYVIDAADIVVVRVLHHSANWVDHL